MILTYLLTMSVAGLILRFVLTHSVSLSFSSTWIELWRYKKWLRCLKHVLHTLLVVGRVDHCHFLLTEGFLSEPHLVGGFGEWPGEVLLALAQHVRFSEKHNLWFTGVAEYVGFVFLLLWTFHALRDDGFLRTLIELLQKNINLAWITCIDIFGSFFGFGKFAATNTTIWSFCTMSLRVL